MKFYIRRCREAKELGTLDQVVEEIKLNGPAEIRVISGGRVVVHISPNSEIVDIDNRCPLITGSMLSKMLNPLNRYGTGRRLSFCANYNGMSSVVSQSVIETADIIRQSRNIRTVDLCVDDLPFFRVGKNVSTPMLHDWCSALHVEVVQRVIEAAGLLSSCFDHDVFIVGDPLVPYPDQVLNRNPLDDIGGKLSLYREVNLSRGMEWLQVNVYHCPIDGTTYRLRHHPCVLSRGVTQVVTADADSNLRRFLRGVREPIRQL